MKKIVFKKFIIWFLPVLYVFLVISSSGAFAACMNYSQIPNKTCCMKKNTDECCCCKKEHKSIKQLSNKDNCNCKMSHIPVSNTEKSSVILSKNTDTEKISDLYNFVADYLNFSEKNINQKLLKYSCIPNINTDIRSTIVLQI